MSRDPRDKGLFPPAAGLCSISLLQMTPEARYCHQGQYTVVCAPRRMHSHSHMVFYHIPLLPKFSGGRMCLSIACINCYIGLFKIWCVFVLSVPHNCSVWLAKAFMFAHRYYDFCGSCLGSLSGQNCVKLTKHSRKKLQKIIQILLSLKSLDILPVREKKCFN